MNKTLFLVTVEVTKNICFYNLFKMWRGRKVLTRSLTVRNVSGPQFKRGFATDAEQRIAQILKKELSTNEVTVVDTSSIIPIHILSNVYRWMWCDVRY